MKRKNLELPNFDKLIIPTLEALRNLGGSGTIEEIREEVYKVLEYEERIRKDAYRILDLEEEILEVQHDENGVQSEVDYRLAWARTYLKKYGLIENSSHDIWALLDYNINIENLDSDQIIKEVREITQKPKSANNKKIDNKEVENEIEKLLDWKESLISTMLKIELSAFERLCKRLLRESGFVQVEVTGKSGDGGIAGKGIVKLNGFLSFHVYFQSNRSRLVGLSNVRDFRGAMLARAADKGLFITAGSFTREAIKEATRDGVPPIGLIDGEDLCDKLKALNLGVKTELIEEITVNEKWFNNI